MIFDIKINFVDTCKLNSPYYHIADTRIDEAKIDFPLLTFCPIRMMTVRPSDSHFYDLLEDKIESQPNATITQLILDHNQDQQTFDMFLRYDIKELITDPYIVDQNDNLNRLTDDRIWSIVYHRVYGPCYTLDINKQNNLNIVKGNSLYFPIVHVYSINHLSASASWQQKCGNGNR